MHTTEGKKFLFHHNGDFSGNIIAWNPNDKTETVIPFSDILTLVAEWKRRALISAAENASDIDILQMVLKV